MKLKFKHFRGRKIHSPFVYDIVRNCLMATDGRQSAEQQIATLHEYLRGLEHYSGEAMCVVKNRGNRTQRREIVDVHNGTSFETRKFLCIFTDQRLPKQHFKL
jgi:hypothetical protein